MEWREIRFENNNRKALKADWETSEELKLIIEQFEKHEVSTKYCDCRNGFTYEVESLARKYSKKNTGTL